MERFDRVVNKKLPRITATSAPSEFADFIEASTRTMAEHRPASAAEALEWIKEIAAAHGIA